MTELVLIRCHRERRDTWHRYVFTARGGGSVNGSYVLDNAVDPGALPYTWREWPSSRDLVRALRPDERAHLFRCTSCGVHRVFGVEGAKLEVA